MFIYLNIKQTAEVCQFQSVIYKYKFAFAFTLYKYKKVNWLINVEYYGDFFVKIRWSIPLENLNLMQMTQRLLFSNFLTLLLPLTLSVDIFIAPQSPYQTNWMSFYIKLIHLFWFTSSSKKVWMKRTTGSENVLISIQVTMHPTIKIAGENKAHLRQNNLLTKDKNRVFILSSTDIQGIQSIVLDKQNISKINISNLWKINFCDYRYILFYHIFHFSSSIQSWNYEIMLDKAEDI